MTINQAFGQTLKRLREDADLSQEALALNCDLDRTFISLLERGLRQPSLATIFTLAKELKTLPSSMVAEVEKSMTRPHKKK